LKRGVGEELFSKSSCNFQEKKRTAQGSFGFGVTLREAFEEGCRGGAFLEKFL